MHLKGALPMGFKTEVKKHCFYNFFYVTVILCGGINIFR